MTKAQKFIDEYISNHRTGEDNQLKAAIGSLHAERTKELTDAIIKLQKQISDEVDKIIESNKQLSNSNNYYANWMRSLTIALIIVTLVVGLLQTVTCK